MDGRVTSTLLEGCLPPTSEDCEIDGLNVELLPHQKTAIPWMVTQERSRNRRGGIVADEQGLGKTFTIIAFLQFAKIRLERRKRPTLIVVPKSVLNQWCSEVSDKLSNEHALSVYRYYGTQKKADSKEVLRHDVVLTTYRTLSACANSSNEGNELFYRTKWNRVILDEAHLVRKLNGVNFKAVSRLHSNFRWCLTGTPMNNSLEDLYVLLQFLHINIPTVRNPKALTVRSPLLPEIRKELQTILIRRTKQSANLRLPSRKIHEVTIDFGKDELARYQSLLTDVDSELKMVNKSGKLPKEVQVSMLKKFTRLNQLCIHPFLVEEVPNLRKMYFDLQNGIPVQETKRKNTILADALQEIGANFSISHLLTRLRNGSKNSIALYKELHAKVMQPSTKISAILSKLRETTSKNNDVKTLIFSQWTSSLDILQYHLRANGHKYCRLDGAMKADMFDEEVLRFKNGKFEVCLISVRAGSVGLNLVEASQVIFLDQWWNPSVEEQAMDRVHRIGQKKSVNVYFFRVRNTIEQRVKEVIERKRRIISAILKSSRTDDEKSLEEEDSSNYRHLTKLLLDDQIKIQQQLTSMNQLENSTKRTYMRGTMSENEFEPRNNKRKNSKQCAKCNCTRSEPITRDFSIVAPIPSVWLGPKYIDERLEPLRDDELEVLSTLEEIKDNDKGISLGKNELRTLEKDNWIHSDVINCFSELLNRRSKENCERERNGAGISSSKVYLKVHMWNTFFYTKMVQSGSYRYENVKKWGKKASLCLPNLDLILVPVHLNGNHWVLVSINIKCRKIFYLDPFHSPDNHSVTDNVRSWFRDEAQARFPEYSFLEKSNLWSWPVIENPAGYPKQLDGSSCGIFVLYYADYLSLSIVPCFSQRHVPLLRKRTALFLFKNKLAGHFQFEKASKLTICRLPSTEFKQLDWRVKVCRHCGENSSSAKKKCDNCGAFFNWIPNQSIREAENCTDASPSRIPEKRKADEFGNQTISAKKSRKGRAYECEECDASFSHRTGLVRHKRFSHKTEENPVYKCSICKSPFKRKDNLNAHVKRAHKHVSIM